MRDGRRHASNRDRFEPKNAIMTRLRDRMNPLSRLRYLAGLGVDAVWLSPYYASPQADAGYDVSDYRQIHPAFGQLEEAGV